MLDKKVHAFNEAQRIGSMQAAKILDLLKPYVGQKIKNKDLSLVASLRNYHEKIGNPAPRKNSAYPEDYVQLHRQTLDINYSSVWFNVTICAKDASVSCFYTDYSAYIGTVSTRHFKVAPGILKELTDQIPAPRKTTVKRQTYLMARIDKLNNEVNTLKHELI